MRAPSGVTIAITFFFQPLRFLYLSEVLRNLSTYPVPVHVVLITSELLDSEADLLQRMAGQYIGNNVELCTRRQHDHPFGMTWDHKKYVLRFLENDSHSHFIYIEDDIRIDFSTLLYFCETRDMLADKGLIPGLVRIETRKRDGIAVATDIYWPNSIASRPSIRDGDTVFVNPTHPYSACYILDRDLAAEYVRSRSFDMEASILVKSDYGPAERSAMGLCFENVPPGFESRSVVPVSASDFRLKPYCCVSHLPNTYADREGTMIGKVPLDELFVP